MYENDTQGKKERTRGSYLDILPLQDSDRASLALLSLLVKPKSQSQSQDLSRLVSLTQDATVASWHALAGVPASQDDSCIGCAR
jgi:hypothetical protein